MIASVSQEETSHASFQEEGERQNGAERQQQQQTPNDAATSTTTKTTTSKQQQRRSGRNPDRKRHGARNQHKSKIFVRWLLETFPQLLKKTSSSSSTNDNKTAPLVVDVAGGKGELAVRLAMCHCLRVVLVDPRPADPARVYETLVLPKLPKKWQERYEQKRHAFEQQEQQHLTKQQLPMEQLQLEEKEEEKAQPASTCSSSPSPCSFLEHTLNQRLEQLVMPLTEQTLATCEPLQSRLQEAALLIGMHADGATEAIIDAALQYHKPFVVIPCCVFPNLFTQRRLLFDDPSQQESSSKETTTGGGTPVRTHEQFCQYLLQRDSRFQQTVLPFEGRNIAIWWDGK